MMRWLLLVGLLGTMPSLSQAQGSDGAARAYARRIELVGDSAAVVADSIFWDNLDAIMSVLPGSQGPPRYSLDSASRVMGWARQEVFRRRTAFAAGDSPSVLRPMHEDMLAGLDTVIAGMEVTGRRIDRCRSAGAAACASSLLDGLELTAAGRGRYDAARARAARLLADRSVILGPPIRVRATPARQPS
jgi:hypothetical protein